ncbi:MAG: T9SS type A sorting domain-containing protein [Ignavibacteria bacterium]|nr:T9SS type A sorting domain-containing protein [Ignavibacteria bacterium]
MNKIIFILLLSACNIFAQTTLTVVNNPSQGDLDGNVQCDTTGISEGNSGANQTWDFTVLSRQDSTTLIFVASGSTPYSQQFPNSNIASTNDSIYFNYMSASASDLLISGFGGPDLIIQYTDPQIYLQYPFNYGSSFNDPFEGEFNSSGTQIFRKGTSAVTGDAWGTINLPDGSYANALRVHYQIITKDSSNPGIAVVSVTNLNSYVWFVPGKKFPVFEIIYSDITINGNLLFTQKVVNYNFYNSPTGIRNISAEIPDGFRLSQNYPNPFNPSTNLEFAIPRSGLVTLKIFDMTGREITTPVNENLNPGKYSYNFNAAGLTSGAYFYTLTANGFSDTKKMILLK